MTAGAIEAHRNGIVTACSIVANGRAFDDAVARLRDAPSLETGVHLTLVEETSLTGIALPKSWRSFLPAYIAGRIKLQQIIDEFRAQIDKALDAGLRITHLNSHQHLHALRQIHVIVLQLAEEYHIGFVRRVEDRGGRERRLAIAALNRLAGAGVRCYTIGVAEAGHLTAARVVELLDFVEDVTELVAHPGIGVTGYAHWDYHWERETAALCDPLVRQAVEARNIERIGPSKL